MEVRRIAVAAMTAALLALGSGTASADTPGCFGQFVHYYAQNPPFGGDNLGEFVGGTASGPSNFGQDDMPFYKSLACG
jgi:hypothetical protein